MGDARRRVDSAARMTPKDRAAEVVSAIDVNDVRLSRKLVEKAIIAAIDEERMACVEVAQAWGQEHDCAAVTDAIARVIQWRGSRK